MLEGIVPIRPFRTKEEYIYDSLRTAILQCKIPPGEKLVIDQLTGVFAASAIPIRSALQRLEGEGLVTIVPHAGAVVSDISVDTVAEIFAIMEALERLAFQFAAQRVQEGDLVELDGLVQRMERACQSQDVDDWSDLNSQFHIKVAEMSKMELLCRFTRATFDYWGRLRRYYLKEIVEDILTAQAEHHVMLRLLRQRQGQELADLVVPHNRRSRDYLLRVMPSAKKS